MQGFWTIALYGVLAGASTLAGMYLVLWNEDFTRRNTVSFVSFAAGVLISTALVALIPEALHLYDRALWLVLAGFLAFYLLEQVVVIHACQEDEECEVHSMGTVSVLGIGFHSVIDGLVIGVGFGVSPLLGLLATVSVIAHKLPDGMTVVCILLHCDYPRRRTIFLSSMVALATPVGALLGFAVLRWLPPAALGGLLALAAGSFLYIAASDLVPETHKKSQVFNIALILLGVMVPFAVEAIL